MKANRVMDKKYRNGGVAEDKLLPTRGEQQVIDRPSLLAKIMVMYMNTLNA